MLRTQTTKLTAAEAARHLQVSPATLEQRRRRNLPPAFYKIGRKVLYERRDLDEFLQKCRVTPGDDRRRNLSDGK